MKVIGLDGNGQYIAIVTHDELEKCANKYYGKLNKLKVGDAFDIGAGYNFASQIKSSCESMLDAHKNFKYAQDTLTSFAMMVSELPTVDQEVQP